MTKKETEQTKRTLARERISRALFPLLPAPVVEHMFHPTRLWRFDYAWPGHKIAVEQEGGIWRQGFGKSGGAHTRPMNVIRDMEKYNAAGLLGWRIFRFTPSEVKKGIAASFMLDVFKASGLLSGSLGQQPGLTDFPGGLTSRPEL